MEDQSMVPNKRKECQEEESATVGRSPKQPSVSRDLLGVELKSDDLPDSLFLDQSKRKLQTTKVDKSPLLSKLGAFLPALQQANVQLEQKLQSEGAAAVTIESVDKDKPHISMDLALGVSDDPVNGLPGGQVVEVPEQEEEEDDDEGDDDDDEEEEEEDEENDEDEGEDEDEDGESEDE